MTVAPQAEAAARAALEKGKPPREAAWAALDTLGLDPFSAISTKLLDEVEAFVRDAAGLEPFTKLMSDADRLVEGWQQARSLPSMIEWMATNSLEDGLTETQAWARIRRTAHGRKASTELVDATIRKIFKLKPGGPPIQSRPREEQEHNPKKLKPKKTAEIIDGDQIKVEPIKAVWDGWLYDSEMTMIFGAPKVGKSTIVNDLIARITSGRPFPGEPPEATREPRRVLLLSAEDDAARVTMPQFLAAGGKPDNISFMTMARLSTGEHVGLDLAADLDILEDAILKAKNAGRPFGLIVVSPITAYMGSDARANNSMNSVRAVLDPMTALIRRHDIAVILIGHSGKSTSEYEAMYQMLGSTAWAAAARVAAIVVKDPETEPDGTERPRLMLRTMNSFSADSRKGFAYRLKSTVINDHYGNPLPNSTAVVEWVGRDDRDPNEIMAIAREMKTKRAEAGKLDGAIAFLTKALAGGPKPSNIIQNEAEAAGINSRTLRRARETLAIISEKRGAITYIRLPFAAQAPDSGESASDEQLPF